jgi:hypothetical protein
MSAVPEDMLSVTRFHIIKICNPLSRLIGEYMKFEKECLEEERN